MSIYVHTYFELASLNEYTLRFIGSKFLFVDVISVLFKNSRFNNLPKPLSLEVGAFGTAWEPHMRFRMDYVHMGLIAVSRPPPPTHPRDWGGAARARPGLARQGSALAKMAFDDGVCSGAMASPW